MQCSSLACKILSMTLLAWEMSAIIQWLEHSLVLTFLGIGMKTDLFQSWATAGSSRFADILNATLDSIILMILNSSTRIISHPLALLTAVLLKAHLTLFHSVWFWVTNHTIVAIEFIAVAAAKLLQSCPTLCDPIDGSTPGSSIHGIFQARVLEWGAIAFSIQFIKTFFIQFFMYSFHLFLISLASTRYLPF